MNTLKYGFIALIGLGVATSAQAADIAAGKKIAATVCAACHGANGISVSKRLPNLAGQRGTYIENSPRPTSRKSANTAS